MSTTLAIDLDGVITRTCADCPTIFRTSDPDDVRCSQCHREHKREPCCDSPHYRTIGARSHPDGATFSKRYCVNCGARLEVES